MTKTELVKKNLFLNESKEDLFTNWIKDLSQHLNPAEPNQKNELVYKAKDFLSLLLSNLNTPSLNNFSFSCFEPLLQVWHAILEQQRGSGVSTKDTARFIFSLKSTVLKSLEEHPHATTNIDLEKLNHLLDLLGLLTFELYSTEKEALLEQKNEQIQYFLKHQLAEPGNFYVSISPKMQAIYKAISLILDNDITVLLEGESGTGKDIFASLIHLNSKRKNKPLIVLNCGAIPKELIESELFGHEKGSFTGATERQLGKFELAEDGTIFLDEISELNIDLQVKLLRVLQNKELQRIGGKEKIKINARVIAATNKDLKKEVETKKFRLDLYYRLNVFPLLLPPLRERKEDIVPLAQFFLKKYAPQYNQQVKEISLDAQFYLQNQTWEGNIRELENIMQRAILLAESPILTVEVFKHIPGQQPQNLLPHQNIENLKLIPEEIIPLAEIEKQTLQKALELTNGNIRKAAQNLKISRTTFYNKLKKYNISLQ